MKHIPITFLALLASHLVAHAAVTDVSHWRMGDQDPSSNPGTFATSTTDQVGGQTMTLFTSSGGFQPIYQADAPPVPAGNSKSMVFSFGAAGYAPVIPSLTDNFGIELWVKPGDLTTSSYLAWNGASNNGWGFVKIANVYQGVIKTPTGVQILVGSGFALLDTWTHLALVRENGLTVFYVNGVAVGISNQEISVPTGYFQLAVAPDLTTLKFVGALDEVRVFTFAPNTFSKTDLLVPRLPLEADDNNAVTTTVGGSGETPRTYHASWMDGLPDSMRVSELSIPGTHDTGAERGNNYGGVPFPSYSDCQDAEVWDQLVSGVRFLDLRIVREEDVFGDWELHHNDTYYYRPLFNVLNEITQFLTDNPSETVLCRLTADVEEDEALFAETYGLIRDVYTNIWQRPGTFRADGVTPTEYADESIDTGNVITNAFLNAGTLNGSYYWPTLGEVRGKMVMFVSPDPLIYEGKGLSSGLAFKADSGTDSFPINTNSLFRLSTRDKFNEFNLGTKQQGDLAHIASASTNRSKTFLYATGLNVAFDPLSNLQTPFKNAQSMNPYLLGWLNSVLLPEFLPKTGIVIMDFPGPAMLQSIIARNFRHNSSASKIVSDFRQYAIYLPSNIDLSVKDEQWQARAWRRLIKERLPSAEFNTFIVNGDLGLFASSVASETNTLSAALGPVLNYGWVEFESHRLPSAYTSGQVKTLLDSTLLISGNVTDIKQQFDNLYPSNQWTVIAYTTTGLPSKGIDFDTNVVSASSSYWTGSGWGEWIVAGSRKPDLVSTNESSRSVVGHWEFPFPDALVGNNLGSGLTNFLGVGVVPESTPGIEMSHGDLPNGGPSAIRMHQWTLVMDLLLEPDSGYRSLLQIDSLDNSTDGDVFINGAGGIGTKSQYYGTVSVGSWHRVVVAVDATQEQLMSLYIDGSKVGEIPTRTFTATGDSVDGYVYSDVDRWSLQDKALLFGDDNGESGDMYVGGIQLRNYKMSDEEIAGLGGVASQADIIANPDGKLFIERADMPELQVNTNGFQRMVKVPDQLKLTWKPGGVLQSSDDLSAPFSDVPDVRSSSTYYPASGPASNAVRQFFRLRP